MQVQDTGLGVAIRGWYLKLRRRTKPLTQRELIDERGGPGCSRGVPSAEVLQSAGSGSTPSGERRGSCVACVASW